MSGKDPTYKLIDGLYTKVEYSLEETNYHNKLEINDVLFMFTTKHLNFIKRSNANADKFK